LDSFVFVIHIVGDVYLIPVFEIRSELKPWSLMFQLYYILYISSRDRNADICINHFTFMHSHFAV